jgi:hypothetical protein
MKRMKKNTTTQQSAEINFLWQYLAIKKPADLLLRCIVASDESGQIWIVRVPRIQADILYA